MEKEYRVKKTLWLCLLALVVSCVPAVAQTVEVLVFVSAPASCPASLAESVLDGCLDALFESGRIGTNARPKPAEREEMLRWVPSAESLGEYVDQAIAVWLSFTEDGESWRLTECEYRFLSAKGEELGAGPISPSPPESLELLDLEAACMSTGGAIVARALGL